MYLIGGDDGNQQKRHLWLAPISSRAHAPPFSASCGYTVPKPNGDLEREDRSSPPIESPFQMHAWVHRSGVVIGSQLPPPDDPTESDERISSLESSRLNPSIFRLEDRPVTTTTARRMETTDAKKPGLSFLKMLRLFSSVAPSWNVRRRAQAGGDKRGGRRRAAGRADPIPSRPVHRILRV